MQSLFRKRESDGVFERVARRRYLPQPPGRMAPDGAEDARYPDRVRYLLVVHRVAYHDEFRIRVARAQLGEELTRADDLRRAVQVV